MRDVPEDPHGADAPEITEAHQTQQESAKQQLLSRRQLLTAVGGSALLAGIGITATEDTNNLGEGSITGGAANLSEAYHVAGGLYIGPDSAKADIDPEAGRYYLASDSEKEYYGDGNQWDWKGIKAPSVHADILWNIRYAAGFDGKTDGIDAAMRDADGPVRVVITEGGGSGPNGEYLIEPKYIEENVYVTEDRRIGVKVDRGDVQFVGQGNPVISPKSGVAEHQCFLVSSFENALDKTAGGQVENVTFDGLVFDGKGRDAVAVTGYESKHCTFENNTVTNWSPDASTAFIKNPVAVELQHHGDNWLFKNNLFKCNTAIQAPLFIDGSHGTRVLENTFMNEAGSPIPSAMCRQNYNGDFDRPSVTTTVKNNVFDQVDEHGGYCLSMEWGLGSRIENNDFLLPLNEAGPVMKIDSRRVADSGRGGLITNNYLQGGRVKFENNGEIVGLRVRDNTMFKTDGDTGTQLIFVVGGSLSDGAVNDLQLKDNYFHNEVDTYDALPNQGRYIQLNHANAEGWDVTGNRSYGARSLIHNPGNADISTWHLDRNQGFTDGLYGGTTEKHGNSFARGTATISSGQTSVTISTGIDVDINIADVMLEQASSLGGASEYWVSDADATDGDFTINLDADPTQDVTFTWRVMARPEWSAA